MKWLNAIGSAVNGAEHAAGGCERNLSTHGKLGSRDRHSQKSATLERNVRCYRNMRLRDRIAERGPNAQKERQRDPKPYPLEKGDWSSCDESEEDSMDGLDRGPDHHGWASRVMSE